MSWPYKQGKSQITDAHKLAMYLLGHPVQLADTVRHMAYFWLFSVPRLNVLSEAMSPGRDCAVQCILLEVFCFFFFPLSPHPSYAPLQPPFFSFMDAIYLQCLQITMMLHLVNIKSAHTYLAHLIFSDKSLLSVPWLFFISSCPIPACQYLLWL